MNNGGDAAEQVVRLSLEGFEVAAKLTGSAAKNVALLLVSVLKQEQQTNMAVQARTRMDGIREKPDGERYGLSLLLTQLCATGLQRLGKPFS